VITIEEVAAITAASEMAPENWRYDAKGDLFCRSGEQLDHTGEIENFKQSSLDKILPVRGMPDLICMSNILQKNPAGSLFPFSKDLCDLDRE